MGGHYLELSTGEVDYYEVDDYTDPWKEPEIVVYQPGQGRHTGLVYHLVPLFCGRVRFIRRDLRGHGRSSEGKDSEYKFDLDTIVAEEAEFIDKVAGKPVHWMCDSTAGMLGLALAHRYPEKVRSLTLMSSPLVLPQAFKDMVRIGRPTWMDAIRELGWAGWQSKVPLSNLGTNDKVKNTNDIGRGSGPEYDKWHKAQQKKHPTEGMALYAEFIQTVDVRGILEEVKVPTLLVAPTQSFASPRQLNEEMAKRIPDCRLEWVDGLGHMTWVDQPETVTSIVLNFINEIVQRKSDGAVEAVRNDVKPTA